MNFVSYALVQKRDGELGCNIFYFFSHRFQAMEYESKEMFVFNKILLVKNTQFFSLLLLFFFLSRKYSEEIYVESLRLCKVEISWAH